MPPYPSFLVFGKVFNSLGSVIVNAQLEVITTIGRMYKFTDSSGLYLYDLAEIGYITRETVTVNITEPFNNEIQTQTYVVEGSFLEENITTNIRTRVEHISELQTQNVLHSVGKKPITKDNPLPILSLSEDGIIFGNWSAIAVNRSDGQPDYIERTTPDGRVYRKTYSYDGNAFYVGETKWILQ